MSLLDFFLGKQDEEDKSIGVSWDNSNPAHNDSGDNWSLTLQVPTPKSKITRHKHQDDFGTWEWLTANHTQEIELGRVSHKRVKKLMKKFPKQDADAIYTESNLDKALQLIERTFGGKGHR